VCAVCSIGRSLGLVAGGLLWRHARARAAMTRLRDIRQIGVYRPVIYWTIPSFRQRCRGRETGPTGHDTFTIRTRQQPRNCNCFGVRPAVRSTFRRQWKWKSVEIKSPSLPMLQADQLSLPRSLCDDESSTAAAQLTDLMAIYVRATAMP